MNENSDRTNFETPDSPTPVVLNSPSSSPSTPTPLIPAGFWRRFAAIMIDGVILFVAQFPILFIGKLLGATQSISWALYSNLIGGLLSFFYVGYFLTTRGATVGKILLSIKVVRKNNQPFDFKTVFLREIVGKFVSGILLCIGYLMAAFRDDKRALHDLLADTQVVLNPENK